MNESVPAARVLPELCSFGAVALAELIRRRDVSAVEVMRTHLDHIERVNPAVNAIISLRPRDELLAEARKADEALARGIRSAPCTASPRRSRISR